MKCNRCGKDTDYYYAAGPVVLCEVCACISVAALSDEGLFPFFDNIVDVRNVPAEEENSVENAISTQAAQGVLDTVFTPEEKVEFLAKMKYMDPEKSPIDYEPDVDTDSSYPKEISPEEQFVEEYAQKKAVLNSLYGMMVENT